MASHPCDGGTTGRPIPFVGPCGYRKRIVNMMELLRRAVAALRNEKGSVATEYGLVLVLIALAIVAAAALFGAAVVNLIQAGADAFP
jgi:Flp pilus assembly pilin Flp